MNDTFHKLVKNFQEVSDIPNISLLSTIQAYANQTPNKDAIIFVHAESLESECLTYKLFYSSILALAHLLKYDYKLQQGDAVALNLANSPDILLFHLACWSIGCISVPLDTKRDDLERKLYKIRETHSVMFVTNNDEEDLFQANIISKKIPTLQIYEVSSKIRAQLAAKEPLLQNEICEQINNPALILFTSGTTALPKGVVLTLQNLLLNANGIDDWLHIVSADRFHIVLPLHHINSTTMSLATLLVGGTIVLSSRYSKSNFWQIMADQQCTISSIVPTICFDLVSEEKSFLKNKLKLKSVSRIQIGSAPVQPSDVIKFYEQYNMRLIQGYGSTETALRVTGVDVWNLNENEYREIIESNTIGSELKWNNIQIKMKNGSVAKEGEVGELIIRGPILTRGYLHNVKATKESFVDGWFHSGDLGYWKSMFSQKVYFISGRKKEILIKGGVNISPLQIENAILKQFPFISSCYVVGYPDNRFGEEICAIISFAENIPLLVRNQTMEQLKRVKEKCEITGISKFETPKCMFEVPLDSLPMTSTGKIQRINIKNYIFEKLTPIAQTSPCLFRKITPFDIKEIDQIAQIHTKRWGSVLSINTQTVTEASKNGVVIAAIEKNTEKVMGSVFMLKMNKKDIEENKKWTRSYDGITDNLTLKSSNFDGNAYVLVSISTEGKPYISSVSNTVTQYNQYSMLAEKYIEEYIKSGKDDVLTFHSQPKFGMKDGARVIRILAQARPKDYEAMGFNVLMQYPQLHSSGEISAQASLGTQLIEAAFLYAIQNNIHMMYAYSRPSGYLRWLSQK